MYTDKEARDHRITCTVQAEPNHGTDVGTYIKEVVLTRLPDTNGSLYSSPYFVVIFFHIIM